MAPIRLAILETDTPLPKVDEAFGSTGYYGVFKSMFERAFANSPTPLSEILTLTRHTVVHNDISSYPPLDTIDAILITGSKHNAFDNDPWILTLVEYTRKALEQKDTKVKVIGVCFGHQIVGRALGAHVARSDNGWEISVTEMKLSEKGKELFGKETLVGAPSPFYLFHFMSHPLCILYKSPFLIRLLHERTVLSSCLLSYLMSCTAPKVASLPRFV